MTGLSDGLASVQLFFALWDENVKLKLFPLFHSGPDDGGVEPLHQDQPGAGVRAPIGWRRPRHCLPAAAYHGHASAGGVVSLPAERERPACSQRHLHARPAHQL